MYILQRIVFNLVSWEGCTVSIKIMFTRSWKGFLELLAFLGGKGCSYRYVNIIL